MNERILELAKLCNGVVFTHDLEKFYKAAHQDGQKQMRERASEEVENLNSHGWIHAKAILKLEIE